MNNFNIKLVEIFNINQDIIWIYINQDYKFFNKNFINIAIKNNKIIKNFKKYDLILYMIILCLKSYFYLVIFTNSYLMIYIYQI